MTNALLIRCLCHSYILHTIFCLSEQRAIMDYLLSNPERSCWVLDGYDEFHSKLTKQEVKKGLLDPENRLPVAELISGLLHHQLLPGCTVVVTCRAPSHELEGISDKVGQLLGWDSHDIKEYVHNFFKVKGENMLFCLFMLFVIPHGTCCCFMLKTIGIIVFTSPCSEHSSI